MLVFFEYLLKLSISLGAVYLFYILVLQRLTFYNLNRRYLLFYSLLCFFIPFTDVTSLLSKNEMDNNKLVNFIPAFNFSGSTTAAAQAANENSSSLYYWQWGFIVLLIGSFLLLLRLAVQYFSFLKMRNAAELLSNEEVKLYRVKDKIIPFSFNNSIFINHEIENGEELKEIILHEFVHVKQKHTIDILFAEFLCIINWYNPFVWLMRKAIRQNLEFIADNNVLQSGFDRKQYQYLLLKVIGVSQFSITQQFNFSSLKKRIAMMNKLKSAKVHLIKFLFALPLTAILLLAFRDKLGHSANNTKNAVVKYAGIVVDINKKEPVSGVVVTDKFSGKQTVTNNNGYFGFEFLPADKKLDVSLDFTKPGYIQQVSVFTIDYKTVDKDSKGLMELIGIQKGSAGEKCESCFSSMSLKYEDELDNIGYEQTKQLLQGYLKKDLEGYDKKIAIVDTPPPPPAAPPTPEINPSAAVAPTPPSPVATPEILDNIERIDIQSKPDKQTNSNRKIATVTLRNGNKEIYNLNDPKEKIAFKNKYGELPAPPPPPAKMGEQRRVSADNKNNDNMVLEVPAKPLYILDGKEMAVSEDLNTINPSDIARVDVLKDKAATEKYGTKGKNGVVKITTKKNKAADVSAEIVEVREVPAARVQLTEVPVDIVEVREVPVAVSVVPSTKINGRVDRVEITESKLPGDVLYYIDDVPATRKQVDALNPKNIQSIDVLKSAEAEKKYGEKGKKGVIKISTKKKLVV
jgi:TonB-dependent SusC/RagA subfamily outer membrane receptor